MLKSFRSRFAEQCHIPVFYNLIRNRWYAYLFSGIIILHLISTKLGFGIWPCPVKTALGIRCPGCGLSKALIHLIRGDWRAALSLHLFAPIFLVGLLLMIMVSILPPRPYVKALQLIKTFEVKTGIVVYILFFFVFYWIIRLIFRL